MTRVLAGGTDLQHALDRELEGGLDALGVDLDARPDQAHLHAPERADQRQVVEVAAVADPEHLVGELA